jgi:hypothetical protein
MRVEKLGQVDDSAGQRSVKHGGTRAALAGLIGTGPGLVNGDGPTLVPAPIAGIVE